MKSFSGFPTYLLEILKYSTLQLMCKNNQLMRGKIEIDDVDFNKNFCIIYRIEEQVSFFCKCHQ